MTGEELLIAGGLLLFLMHSGSHESGGPIEGGSDGDGTVKPTTTTVITDNKATRTGSTFVELANDAKIVATDGVSIFNDLKTVFGSDDGSSDDTTTDDS